MPSLSSADHRTSPPTVDVPRDYNAAHDLIERNLAAGRAAKETAESQVSEALPTLAAVAKTEGRAAGRAMETS